MVGYYEKLVSQYPIISIEDGLAEDDWAGWKLLNKKLGKKIQIVGDDIFVTNPEIIKRGIKEKSGNAVLIKVNQIGTVSETVEAVKIYQSYRLADSYFSPQRRNRRHLYRRFCRGTWRRSDKNRLSFTDGQGGKV